MHCQLLIKTLGIILYFRINLLILGIASTQQNIQPSLVESPDYELILHLLYYLLKERGISMKENFEFSDYAILDGGSPRNVVDCLIEGK